MLTFLTLFLGIAGGPRNVELSAGDAVAAIELRLDGVRVGTLAGPPWSTVVDFGDPPKPHELLAVGFDKGGKEIARAVQRINLSRSLAEATLQLLPGQGGRGRFVRLTWKCAVAVGPERTRVTFDGKPIPAPDPSRIPLPAYVPEQLHFIRADLDFPRNLTATAEIVFGGQNRDETQAELTAVAVLSESKKLPVLDGAFVARGEPLSVVAVENEGPAEIAIVLDEAARPLLASVAARPYRIGAGIDSLRRIAPLTKDQRARFVWPITEAFRDANTRYEVFPCSPDFDRAQGGLLFLMTQVFAPGISPSPRLADAVAVAALSAVARSRARAVVLVLAGSPDASLLSPRGARGYLSAVGAPLFVWTVGPKGLAAGAEWAGATDVADVSTTGLFEKGAERLFAYLKRQKIVWVEGTHLPQDVALSASAKGLTLVR